MVELNQTILSSPPYDLAAGPYEEEKFWQNDKYGAKKHRVFW